MRTFLLLLVGTLCARGEVTLASLFTDHGVLQHSKALPVWGRAEPGERVEVSLGNQRIGTTTDSAGRWLVVLEPLPPSATPAELVVVGKNTLRITDLLVGEVWLCAGQGWMELPLRSTVSALTDTAAAAGLNAVRQFRVGHSVSTTPEDGVDGTWKTCSPEVAGEFGAIGFYFARELHMRTGMPVGIVQAAWAESRLESWLSPAALASEPAFSTVNEQWLAGMAEYPRKQAEYTASLAAWNQEFAAAKSKNQKFNKPAPTAPWGPGHAATPSGAYHGMIHPLTPYALRGILWQPGSNVSYPGHYERETGALISYWRQHFGQADLPFFWIQLPAVHTGEAQGTEWALIRDAQTAALVYPLTGQVVTIDFDETYDSFARNAREVARRLMLLARARVYGAQLDYSGPLFASAAPEGASMRVRFTHGSNALISRDKPLQSFQLAGPDKKFVPATARIERDTVVVTAPGVLQPVAVRYAWMNDPEANLFNGAGLPAAPFRSDRDKRMENGE